MKLKLCKNEIIQAIAEWIGNHTEYDVASEEITLELYQNNILLQPKDTVNVEAVIEVEAQ
jgi:hypothetical protein